LTIDDSRFSQGNLRMHFTDVADGFLTGREITLRCSGFRNPIYPDIWKGFSMFVYDYNNFAGRQE